MPVVPPAPIARYGPPPRRLCRAPQGIPRRLLLIATYGLGIGMGLYGALGLVVDGLRLLGVLPVPSSAWTSLRWHVFLWDPWWIVGGLLFVLAARLTPRHEPGA